MNYSFCDKAFEKLVNKFGYLFNTYYTRRNKMKVRYLLIGVVVLFAASLLFAVSSEARMDPKTIAGIWLFDEGKGKDVKDSSGNENNGTLANEPKWVDGKFGKAMTFDGVSTYVDCGNGENLDITKEITVMAWVKFSGLDFKGGGGNLFSIGAKGYPDALAPHAGWWFSYDNRSNGQGFPYACFGNKTGGWSGGGNSFAGYTFVFTNGDWYHLAFTVAKSIAKLYIDGVQLNADKTFSNLVLSDTSRDLFIGCADRSWFFNGAIDEFAIFNVQLGEQDIQTIMNEGLEKSTTFAVDFKNKLATTWGSLRKVN